MEVIVAGMTMDRIVDMIMVTNMVKVADMIMVMNMETRMVKSMNMHMILNLTHPITHTSIPHALMKIIMITVMIMVIITVMITFIIMATSPNLITPKATTSKVTMPIPTVATILRVRNKPSAMIALRVAITTI